MFKNFTQSINEFEFLLVVELIGAGYKPSQLGPSGMFFRKLPNKFLKPSLFPSKSRISLGSRLKSLPPCTDKLWSLRVKTFLGIFEQILPKTTILPLLSVRSQVIPKFGIIPCIIFHM